MGKKKQEFKFAELFAGCGGLSLGLESAGFQRVFANELSPMAASTYVHNLAPKQLAEDGEGFVRICDRKRREDDPERWQDDPRAYFEDEISDVCRSRLHKMDGSMFVGSVDQLLRGVREAKENNTLDPDALKLDLLAGGPPCQSFSCAGRRQRDNPRNSLPFRMVAFAELLKPRVVVLENVSGILRPFQKGDGGLAHAWLDIAEAFYKAGYVPICTHSSALHYGVPQSRHRFIMICLRTDVAELCDRVLRNRPKWKSLLELIMNAHDHLQCDSVDTPAKYKKDAFRWVDATSQPDLWPKSLLVHHKEGPNVVKAINDLPRLDDRHGKTSRSDYARHLARHLPVPAVSGCPKSIDGVIANHEFRSHCIRVRARFHILRLLANKLGTALGSDDLQSLTIEQKNSLLKHKLLFLDAESLRRPKDLAELDALLVSLVSQKHSQKALRKDRHAPAQLTIPDDLVHYAEDRTLTVREMARFQSFPDDFEFTGKVTTGGRLRSYEVPQYTQVGNAVPPLLARAVGKGLVALFKALED